MNKGLRETPIDERDFKVGSLTKLPSLDTLPKTFELESITKDQQNTDYCSAFASTGASEYQEGVELSPEWHFAASKDLSGDTEDWGQDLRTAMKTSVKYGDIKQSDAPFSLKDKDDKFLRDFKNWPIDLRQKALEHKKKSFIKVEGQYDSYDNVRATIFKFKCPIVMGLNWSWPISQYVLDNPKDNGFGHAVRIIGWTEDGLIIQNSAGSEAGIDGKHILPREVANKFIDKFSAFFFFDLSTEEVREVIKRGIMLEQLNLMNRALILISILVRKINENFIKPIGEIVGSLFQKRID